MSAFVFSSSCSSACLHLSFLHHDCVMMHACICHCSFSCNSACIHAFVCIERTFIYLVILTQQIHLSKGIIHVFCNLHATVLACLSFLHNATLHTIFASFKDQSFILFSSFNSVCIHLLLRIIILCSSCINAYIICEL